MQQAREADTLLAFLAAGARDYYARTGRFPAPDADYTPALGECCKHGGQCAGTPAIWQHEPWTSLRFLLDKPHRFSFRYQANDASAVFTASAEPQCDGEKITRSLLLRKGDKGLEQTSSDD